MKPRRKSEHDLKTSKSNGPRKYWKMLNVKSSKSNTIPVSMHEMSDHFKTLNEAGTSDRNDTLHDNTYNEVEGEIRKVIKSLK